METLEPVIQTSVKKHRMSDDDERHGPPQLRQPMLRSPGGGRLMVFVGMTEVTHQDGQHGNHGLEATAEAAAATLLIAFQRSSCCASSRPSLSELFPTAHVCSQRLTPGSLAAESTQVFLKREKYLCERLTQAVRWLCEQRLRQKARRRPSQFDEGSQTVR
ncbi:hypothetical protein KCU62_g146, partial [Aureobasidium sp. EXF-3399]